MMDLARTIKAPGRIMGLVLSAGVGSRAKYLTDPTRNIFALSKPILPILDIPAMHHSVLEFRRVGINDIFANIWSTPETIKQYYSGDQNITFYDENDQGRDC